MLLDYFIRPRCWTSALLRRSYTKIGTVPQKGRGSEHDRRPLSDTHVRWGRRRRSAETARMNISVFKL